MANGLDLAPYAGYLDAVKRYFLEYNESGAPLALSWSPDNVGQLFDYQYLGHQGNPNPYGTTQGRDVLRSLAESLGLTSTDADRAALDFANAHFSQYGQTYSEASHPAIVADEIAKRLYEQAGKPYESLSQEQHTQYAAKAAEYQQQVKEAGEDEWKRDPLGSVFAFESNNLGNILDEFKKNPERAFVGAADPLSTSLWNPVFGEDWDSIINQYGGPTNDAYKDAAKQGIEVSGSAFYHQIAQMIASYYANQGIQTGTEELGTLAQSAGAGQYFEYAKQAKDWLGYYKQYEKFKEGKDENPGALIGAAASVIKVGDFDSSAFSGDFAQGDNPYDANSFFNDEKFGSNQAGGAVYDEYGNWMDGEYDQYGNFVPSDQTTFGDDYGAGYGQGNDIFGGGNLEQSNPELFSDGSSGFSSLLKSLGGLFSGGSSGLSGLLGGSGSGGNGVNPLAIVPILAAIQHARQQGPFDTSRLTGLADQYSPDAMAYQYDRNTEDQRRSLTSSLADRGVMGSSFGNMDISNFNTNRELGRGALISQASLGGADIANKILQAQIAQRDQQNKLYGSSLYALGNVFGGKR